MDDLSEIGLAPEQLAKIDDIEAEKRALPHCDDRRVARTAGQQRNLADEPAWPTAKGS